MSSMRLSRFLSQAGVAARRKAEVLISGGHVKVNGECITELGTKVNPDVDFVQVDGQEVLAEAPFYVLLNKPKACITAVTDDRGRHTVMDYLPNLPVKIAPVGRLDYYSEGVLLLTNDGELSAALQSPSSHVEKTYHVKVRGVVEAKHITAMRRGMRLLDGTRTRPAQVDRLRTPSRHEWLVITLTEGKSRQIHRMLEVWNYQISKLQRVAFAGMSFHGLRVGDARELTQDEVNDLRGLVGLKKHAKAVAQGTWGVRREQSEGSRKIRRIARVTQGRPGAVAEAERKKAAKKEGRKVSKRTRAQPKGRASARSAERRTTRGTGTKAAPKRGSTKAAPKRGSTKAAPKRGSTKAAPKRGSTKAAPKRGSTKAAPKRGSTKAAPKRGSTKAAPKRGTKAAPKRATGRPPRRGSSKSRTH